MTTLFTRKDYDALPEGFPAQLVEGVLVKEPAPTYGHQRIALKVARLLLRYVEEGCVVMAPSDVGLDEHNVYQPDVLVLRTVPPDDVRDVGIPGLAVEVLSVSTRHRDRDVKTRHLLEAGVAEVWLVDPEQRTIERHTADGVTKAVPGDPLRSRAVPGFALEPEDLLARP
jgi:Uma2 family endonuclease